MENPEIQTAPVGPYTEGSPEVKQLARELLDFVNGGWDGDPTGVISEALNEAVAPYAARIAELEAALVEIKKVSQFANNPIGQLARVCTLAEADLQPKGGDRA